MMDPEMEVIDKKDFGELINEIWERYSEERSLRNEYEQTIGYITAFLFVNFGPCGKTQKGIVGGENTKDMVEKVCMFYHEKVKELEIYLAQANRCE